MGDIRSRILEADDTERELLEIPEWGVTVEVRSLSARDRAAFNRRVFKDGEGDLEKWYTDMAIASVYDPDTGDRVFDQADRDTLAGKSVKALERIIAAANRVSALTVDALDEAVEDLGKTEN